MTWVLCNLKYLTLKVKCWSRQDFSMSLQSALRSGKISIPELWPFSKSKSQCQFWKCIFNPITQDVEVVPGPPRLHGKTLPQTNNLFWTLPDFMFPTNTLYYEQHFLIMFYTYLYSQSFNTNLKVPSSWMWCSYKFLWLLVL